MRQYARSYNFRIYIQKIFCTTILLFLCATNLHSQAWEWTCHGAYPFGPGNEGSSGIVVDSSGDYVYYVGYYNNQIQFDYYSTNQYFLASNLNSQDIFLAKMKKSGEIIWIKSYGGPNSETARTITVDNRGDIFVAGWFNPDIEIGPFSGTTNGGDDIFIAKFDSAGIPLWLKTGGGLINDRANSIICRENGDVVVGGQCHEMFTYDTIVSTVVNTNAYDWYVLITDSTGSGLKVLRGNSSLGSGINKVFFDHNKNVLAVGTYDGKFWLIRVDSNNVVVQSKISLGNAGISAEGGGCDAQGNIYVCGAGDRYFYIDTLWYNCNPWPDIDAFAVKLDSNMNALWAKRGGSASFDVFWDGVVDINGNFHVVGQHTQNVTFSNVTIPVSQPTYKDAYCINMDSNGIVYSVIQAGDSAQYGDAFYRIVTDPEGSLYFVGGTDGYLMLGDTLGSGPNDAFFAKYNFLLPSSVDSYVSNMPFKIAPSLLASGNPFMIYSPEWVPGNKVKIAFYNSSGALTHSSSEQYNGTYLFAPQLSPGLYFVKVESVGKSYFSKVIIY